MNVSLQASGGRHLAPADPSFPWRCIIIECGADGEWTRSSVFEAASQDDAEQFGLTICCIEPWSPGVTIMHFYVGEVANG